ncbi:hypothetical protein [Streptomyces sp. NBC_01233]|uniref:hypothetical protein n=1 Tax=Streptomyces sp. NBC_01233 TaxID=2903787 RepID=UPI002E10CF0B|nr:hypothetical protein OG332_05630 [Streptomyces sp. NBC_01233]
MARTWTRRLVLLSASTALAAGGAALPSSAFAAPAPHPGSVTTTAVSADGGSTVSRGYGRVVRPRDRSDWRMTYRRGAVRYWW